MFGRFFGGVSDGNRAGSIAPHGLEQQQRSVEKAMGYRNLAKDCIERGVTCEEHARVVEALRYYRQAAAVIAEGLSVTVAASSTHPVFAELTKWKVEMDGRTRALERTTTTSTSTTTSTTAGLMPKSSSAPCRTQNQHVVASRNSSFPHPPPPPSSSSKAAGNKERDESDKIRAMIENEILDGSPGVRWDDIAGLTEAKAALNEAVILPGMGAPRSTRTHRMKHVSIPRAVTACGDACAGSVLIISDAFLFLCVSFRSASSGFIQRFARARSWYFVIRPARQRQDDARQGVGNRGKRDILRHLRLVAHLEMGGRRRETRAGVVSSGARARAIRGVHG